MNEELMNMLFVCFLKCAIKAFQVDNGDRYALTTLTISRSWSFSPTVQFLRRRYDVSVAEDVPIDTALLALAINKPAHPVSISSIRFD